MKRYTVKVVNKLSTLTVLVGFTAVPCAVLGAMVTTDRVTSLLLILMVSVLTFVGLKFTELEITEREVN